MKQLEARMQRLVALVWLAASAIATQGVWQGRRASGRAVGRPFTRVPRWLFAVLVPPYLFLLYRLWRPLPVRLSAAAGFAASAVGTALSIGGIGLFVWSRLAMGRMYNVSSTLGVQLYERQTLITHGPYALVRHPMYAGALIAAAGSTLLYRTWGMLLILAHEWVFLIRAHKEEQALAAEFGREWQAYCQRVPGWLPRIRRPSAVLPV